METLKVSLVTLALTVQADAFSAGAVAKIEALGGKAEVI